MPTLLVVCLAMTNTVNAVEAAITIEAPDIISAPGETFTVNITITGAVNLWGWSCVVSWNSNVVDCTGKQLGPFNPSGMTLLGLIDNEKGEIPKLVGGTMGTQTVSGDGVLGILTFTAKAMGDVNLDVSEADYINYPSKEAFNMTVQQAEIIVVPEIPAPLIIPLFLIATAATVLMAKRGWSRRS